MTISLPSLINTFKAGVMGVITWFCPAFKTTCRAGRLVHMAWTDKQGGVVHVCVLFYSSK